MVLTLHWGLASACISSPNVIPSGLDGLARESASSHSEYQPPSSASRPMASARSSMTLSASSNVRMPSFTRAQ